MLKIKLKSLVSHICKFIFIYTKIIPKFASF